MLVNVENLSKTTEQIGMDAAGMLEHPIKIPMA